MLKILVWLLAGGVAIAGTNNLPTEVGPVIQLQHINKFKQALSGDVVPRDSSGVVGDSAASLGSSTYRWANVYTPSLFLQHTTSTAIQFQTPTLSSGSWIFTWPSYYPVASNAFLVLATNGVSSYVNVDGTSLAVSGSTLSIPTDGVTTAKIANSNVTTAKIADANVTGAKIANLTISAVNIASGTITSTQIASGTIGGGNIASATITGTNIASNTAIPGTATTVGATYPVATTAAASGRFKVVIGVVPSVSNQPSGVGWSETRTGTGHYTVTFAVGNRFSTFPSISFSAIGTGGEYAELDAEPTTSGFSYSVYDAAATLVNTEVTFTAIGLD